MGACVRARVFGGSFVWVRVRARVCVCVCVCVCARLLACLLDYLLRTVVPDKSSSCIHILLLSSEFSTTLYSI